MIHEWYVKATALTRLALRGCTTVHVNSAVHHAMSSKPKQHHQQPAIHTDAVSVGEHAPFHRRPSHCPYQPIPRYRRPQRRSLVRFVRRGADLRSPETPGPLRLRKLRPDPPMETLPRRFLHDGRNGGWGRQQNIKKTKIKKTVQKKSKPSKIIWSLCAVGHRITQDRLRKLASLHNQ